MDVLYKGSALLFTQVTCTARLLVLLPCCVLAALANSIASRLWQRQRPRQQQQQQQPHPGATFLEGRVMHTRRRPVDNSFE
jgi:hypothetical protein